MRNLGLGSLIVAIILGTQLAILQPPANATSPQQPELAGQSAIVVDATTGSILYERNATERLAPASLTKLFTSYFAIESTPLQRRMTVEKDDLVGEASAGLEAGENLSFETLLNGLLLASGNDAAMTIARNVGENRSPAGLDGVTSFIDYVNSRLASLGLNDTHLQNPHGLDQEGHYSSARDVAAMTMLALQTEPDFLRVASSPGYTAEGYQFSQRNQLIGNYPGALGGKTGITDNAGYCLMGIAHRDGRTMIGVVLGSTSEGWYSDVMALLDYGFATAVTPGKPSISLSAQQPATTLAAMHTGIQGLEIHAANIDTATVRPAAGPAGSSWAVLQWPVAAILAMIVALVTVVQMRALAELHKRPLARGHRPITRRPVRARPALHIQSDDTQPFTSVRGLDRSAASWSVSVGD